jgi:alpha-beta hydrolase superfamily lysophospholipase
MSVVDRGTETIQWATPEGPAPRGTIIVIPGRGEQPSLYNRFGRRLAADAYHTVAVTNPVDDPARSRHQVAELVEASDSPRPLVLVGSDTGALFATQLVASGELQGVDALVLAGLPTTPHSEPPRPAGEQPYGWDAELEDRTTCPTHRKVLTGPGLRRGALYEPLPEGWLGAADLAAVDVPVLGLHGTEDILSPLATARAKYASASTVELASVAGARHDALNDQSHRSVAATVVLFLERLRAGAQLAPIAHYELRKGFDE